MAYIESFPPTFSLAIKADFIGFSPKFHTLLGNRKNAKQSLFCGFYRSLFRIPRLTNIGQKRVSISFLKDFTSFSEFRNQRTSNKKRGSISF
jgi:hypothetical protein